jgi:hypothetical protein
MLLVIINDAHINEPLLSLARHTTIGDLQSSRLKGNLSSWDYDANTRPLPRLRYDRYLTS